MMVKSLVAFAAIALIVSCGKSKNSTNATKAATALSSAFNSGSRAQREELARRILEAEVAKYTDIAHQIRREDPPMTLSCAMFTETSFCSRSQEFKDAEGATAFTCAQAASGDNCTTTCDGTGTTASVECGSDKISMKDLKMTATLVKPTCTESAATLTMTFCVNFDSMTAEMTLNETSGALSCSGNMCMTMTMPTDLSTIGAGGAAQNAPKADSTMACTLNGAKIDMDFEGGSCSK